MSRPRPLDADHRVDVERSNMKRIEVDFNTLTSEPIDLVKLAKVGTEAEHGLPPLCEGERVLLWEPGLEAEGIIVLYGGDYWMARPDVATYRDTPLTTEIETGALGLACSPSCPVARPTCTSDTRAA